MSTIENELLLHVFGGQSSTPPYNFTDGTGRVGPGQRWQFLGNHYTPEAYRHDMDVRQGLQQGMSPLRAHVNALPTLPAAAGSWLRAQFRPGPNDVTIR